MLHSMLAVGLVMVLIDIQKDHRIPVKQNHSPWSLVQADGLVRRVRFDRLQVNTPGLTELLLCPSLDLFDQTPKSVDEARILFEQFQYEGIGKRRDHLRLCLRPLAAIRASSDFTPIARPAL